MDYQSLVAFITLCNTLHFRKASEQLHTTPSTLSRKIQRLENEVGATLFERNKRSVELTEAGKRFYEFAQISLSHYETFQNTLHENSPDKLKGEIKLYATVTAAYRILPPILKAFREKYPQIVTYLETGPTKNGLRHLKEGSADFVIGIISPFQKSPFEYQKILETPLVYITLQGTQRPDIGKTPLIFPAGGELNTLINDYLDAQHLHPPIHSYVEGHEAILAMVAAGLGAAILPKIVIDNSHLNTSITMVPLTPSLPKLDVGLFMKPGTSAIKQAFWEFIKMRH